MYAIRSYYGYNMVIYLAAITGISDEYYEAAQIDGANIFHRIWYITLPMLKSTFVVLLLFALGVITSYSIHYTKLYDAFSGRTARKAPLVP